MTDHTNCPPGCHSHWCSDHRSPECHAEYIDHCTDQHDLAMLPVPAPFRAVRGVCGACEAYEREQEQHWDMGVGR